MAGGARSDVIAAPLAGLAADLGADLLVAEIVGGLLNLIESFLGFALGLLERIRTRQLLVLCCLSSLHVALSVARSPLAFTSLGSYP
jgi:hypothetical protein